MMAKQKVMLQEEIEALFISVRDIILARPNEDIAELAGLINNSPRRRRMHDLELDDLQHLLQVSHPPPRHPPPPQHTHTYTPFSFFPPSRKCSKCNMLDATVILP